MLDFEHLRSLELEWEDIDQSYRLSPYNAPENRNEEQKKVFTAYGNGQIYNPQFLYKASPQFPVAHIREFVKRLAPDRSPIEALYYEKASEALLAIYSIQTHNSDIITGASCLNYGLPDSQLLGQAHKILSEYPVSDIVLEQDISSEKAVEWMQAAMEHNGFQNWRAVTLEPMNANVSVESLDKQVRIRKEATFSRHTLERLLIHELGVHVLRYENGSIQPINLFRNGFPGYIGTEEGLAVISEEHFGMLEINTLRKYAGRVIAAHLALNQTFFQVFQTLVPLLGQETAFEIAIRAKRGFTDTAQPGAHTKDIIYLRGYLQIKAYLEQQPQDYPLLFTGKVGLQHLPLISELIREGVVTLPTLLPKNIKLPQL